jgi:hypothetical protein
MARADDVTYTPAMALIAAGVEIGIVEREACNSMHLQ